MLNTAWGWRENIFKEITQVTLVFCTPNIVSLSFFLTGYRQSEFRSFRSIEAKQLPRE